MTPPSAREVLALWRASWPEREPHPRGLQDRLGPQATHVWQRDPTGRLIAFAAFRAPDTRPLGHLRLILVHPAHRRQGLGHALVHLVRERLGNVTLAAGEESGHFLPGAPAPTLPFFQAVGFTPTGGVAVDMACPLPTPHTAAGWPGRLQVADARNPLVAAGVLDLTRLAFSARWTADTAHVLGRAPAQVLALLDAGHVVGFALTALDTDPVILPSVLYPDALRRATGTAGVMGGLGPVGLHPNLRGQGHGRAFMLAAMRHLHDRGAQAMGIDWTGIAPFYERLGFRTWAAAHHLRG